MEIEAVAVLLMAAVAVVLGEVGVIPNGVVMPHSQEEFVLNTIAIILTVVGIPGAIRLFTLNTTRGLRRMNYDEALNSYHIWSAVRMVILCVTTVFDVAVYYVATSVSGAFCALITLCAVVYCWPSKGKIDSYLKTVNNE